MHLGLDKWETEIKCNSQNAIKSIDLEDAIKFIEQKIRELSQENESLNLESNEEDIEPNRNNEIEYYIESIRGRYENVLDCLNGLKYLVERKY